VGPGASVALIVVAVGSGGTVGEGSGVPVGSGGRVADGCGVTVGADVLVGDGCADAVGVEVVAAVTAPDGAQASNSDAATAIPPIAAAVRKTARRLTGCFALD
jgi:hypothetical protein